VVIRGGCVPVPSGGGKRELEGFEVPLGEEGLEPKGGFLEPGAESGGGGTRVTTD